MIRRAAPGDVPAMVALIHDLAAYERASQSCTITPALLHAALFGADPAAFAHVAVAPEPDPAVVGTALWFRSFSTWDGVHGIYLEDLYVTPAHRGSGHGRALLAALARECARNGYTRLEWSVLDWNTPAIGFYTALGARPLEEWTTFRVSGEALTRLAASAGSGQHEGE